MTVNVGGAGWIDGVLGDATLVAVTPGLVITLGVTDTDEAKAKLLVKPTIEGTVLLSGLALVAADVGKVIDADELVIATACCAEVVFDVDDANTVNIEG